MTDTTQQLIDDIVEGMIDDGKWTVGGITDDLTDVATAAEAEERKRVLDLIDNVIRRVTTNKGYSWQTEMQRLRDDIETGVQNLFEGSD